jgi:type VI protein secretion system component VasF
LNDEKQLDQAKSLLAEYQQQRQAQVHAEYEALKQQGRQRRMIDLIREHPLRFLLYLILVAVVAYFSISPFVRLG